MRNVNSMCSPKAPLHVIQHSPGPRWSSGTSRGVTILPNMHVNETWSLVTLSMSSYAFIDSLLRRGLQAASGCRGARRHSAGCRDTPPRSARTVTASAHEASTPKAPQRCSLVPTSQQPCTTTGLPVTRTGEETGVWRLICQRPRCR